MIWLTLARGRNWPLIGVPQTACSDARIKNEVRIAEVAVNGRGQLHPIRIGHKVIVNVQTILGRSRIHPWVRLGAVTGSKIQIRDAQRLRQQVGFIEFPIHPSASFAARIAETQLRRGCSTQRPPKHTDLVQIQPPPQARIAGVQALQFIQHKLHVQHPAFDGCVKGTDCVSNPLAVHHCPIGKHADIRVAGIQSDHDIAPTGQVFGLVVFSRR